jgi:hypothetical protein
MFNAKKVNGGAAAFIALRKTFSPAAFCRKNAASQNPLIISPLLELTIAARSGGGAGRPRSRFSE